jgi:ATP-dependent protease ClpP protease subunit
MPADLLIYTEIGDYYDGISVTDVDNRLSEIGSTDVLNVRIHSVGGDVGHGTAIRSRIIDYARQQKALNADFKMFTWIDGYCYSIATVIAHNGSEIIMAQGSSMMTHCAWSLGFGTAKDMRRNAEVLEMHDSNIASIFAASTGKSQEDIKALMEAETWFTPEQAVAAKFASRVDTAKARSADPEVEDALKTRSPGAYRKLMHTRAKRVADQKKTSLSAAARFQLLELETELDFFNPDE